jgi:acetylornithine/N-succinyldiaminopimelate aminotransferase
MDTDYLINQEKQSHMNTYSRFPVVLVKGRGTKVWDAEGKEYTDFLSGIGVLNLGHCPAEVVEAVAAQAGELMHVSNLFYTKPQVELASKLSEIGGGRCFFANSGAEANEAALKLARRWGKLNFTPEKTEFVTALGSFHGRTMATLAATGQPAKNSLFEPLPAGFSHVPFNDIEAMEAAVNENTCAVMLEAVQGEAGVWPARPDYLQAVRKLCDERQVLLILDEVQTGLGRTGEFFAFQRFGIEPDIITLAKSLGAGFPIGAVIARGAVADSFGPGDHGSTFGGNPVACAAGLATLKFIEENRLVERSAALGDYFRRRLTEAAARTGLITDVRGLGLMLGLTLQSPNARQVVYGLLEAGFITNHIGERIIRFLPPLIVTEGEIDALAAALERTIVSLEKA